MIEWLKIEWRLWQTKRRMGRAFDERRNKCARAARYLLLVPWDVIETWSEEAHRLSREYAAELRRYRPSRLRREYGITA